MGISQGGVGGWGGSGGSEPSLLRLSCPTLAPRTTGKLGLVPGPFFLAHSTAWCVGAHTPWRAWSGFTEGLPREAAWRLGAYLVFRVWSTME